MRKTMIVAGLLAVLGWGQVCVGAADHPELSEADEAYSAENYEKAAALYRKDAELGVIVAQVNLAFMYLDGLGVAQDFQQAAQWFQKAAEQGNAEAQQNLGLLYEEGKGVARNLVEADQWFAITGASASAARVEKSLSPEQVAEAKRRAEAWKAAHQKSKAR